MTVGTRPIGNRALGDSAGQVPVAVAVAVLDLTKAGSWQWNMPGVSAAGGGIGWTRSYTSLGQDNTGSDTGAATEGQSLAALLSSADTAAATESQSLVVARSTSDSAVATETESVIKSEGPKSYAIAYIYENPVPDPQTEGVAVGYVFENFVDAVPTPHIWYIVPNAASRGAVVTIVGMGFGSTADEYEAFVTLGATQPAIENWRSIVPSPNALSSERSIDTVNDTVDPGHDRIDFRIPDSAVSSDVKVYLNAPDLLSPALLTELGDLLLSESGDYLTVE